MWKKGSGLNTFLYVLYVVRVCACVVSKSMCEHVVCGHMQFVCVCWGVSVSRCECVSSVCTHSQCNRVCAKRVIAGSLGRHLISYLVVLFSSLMAWGVDAVQCHVGSRHFFIFNKFAKMFKKNDFCFVIMGYCV
jgi:hypothetical protein